MHKAIKIIAAREARTINSIAVEALAEYLAKKSKCPEPMSGMRSDQAPDTLK